MKHLLFLATMFSKRVFTKEREAYLIKTRMMLTSQPLNQIIFLSLKGLGLIIIITKLRSYQKWGFLLDQKHIFEISLAIQLTSFLTSFQSSSDVCSASHTKHTARAIADCR